MELPKIEDIIRVSKIHPSRIHNIYVFGSRVYGTATSESDWDIIMVANNSVESTEIKHPIYNIHIYTPDKFKADLEWHRINNIECLYAPEWAKLKESIQYKFVLDVNKLRHSISHSSSSSWVKAKKKLILTDEYKTGIKSLFHSIRIPIFATQLVKENKIDFESSNYIWEKISSKEWTWEDLDSEFRELHNSIMSNFRIVNNKELFKRKKRA